MNGAGVVHCAPRLRRGINWASWLIVRSSDGGQLQMDRVCPKFGSHHHQRLRATCSTGSMKRWTSICVFPRESATPPRMSCDRGQADMCTRGCHLAVPSVAYSICDGAELAWHKTPAISDLPDRHETTRAWYTFATRDRLGFLADCSWFRRWTAADGPGMPKIRLAPQSALTCDVQHGQHEEVTKHQRFSSRKCHSAQNVVCTWSG